MSNEKPVYDPTIMHALEKIRDAQTNGHLCCEIAGDYTDEYISTLEWVTRGFRIFRFERAYDCDQEEGELPYNGETRFLLIHWDQCHNDHPHI